MKNEIKERIDCINRGEVPEGYKRTRVGIIPKEWDVKKLSDISIINAKSLTDKTDSNYKFSYYDLSCVERGKVFHPEERILFTNAPSRARRIFGLHDVLISTVRPYLKGFAFIDFNKKDCICSTGFAVLSCKAGTDTKIIYYNLFSYSIERQISRILVGSNYPAINNSDVESLKIIYPPAKKEQKKIASILSIWDRAIELKEELIEQKRLQRRGLMQNLLTGRVRVAGFERAGKEEIKGRLEQIAKGEVPEGYKRTKAGIIPEEWALKHIVDICSIIDYRGKTPNKVENGIFLITAKNVKKGYIDYEISKEYVSELDYDEIMRRGKPCCGDILFTTEAPLGNVAVINNENVALAQRIIKLSSLKSQIDNLYIKYLLLSNYFQEEVVKESTGSTVKGIKGSRFKKIKVYYPSHFEEQKAIASILSTADRELELLEKKLEALKEQKKGLMQLLLTGKVRVKI